LRNALCTWARFPTLNDTCCTIGTSASVVRPRTSTTWFRRSGMKWSTVLLVASIAREEPALLFIGLSFSVLFMGFAANYVARLIERYQWINYVGLAVIVWVALNMIYDGWVGGEHVLGLRHVLGLD